MASYTYDDSGNMALFFIITILFMILVPFTLSQISSSQGTCGAPCISLRRSLTRGPHSGSEIPSAACECSACVDKRARIRKREKGSILRPNITKKCVPSFGIPLLTTDPLCRSLFVILGWAVFGVLSYKVMNTTIENKIYNPFEILGIGSVSNDPSAPFPSRKGL